MGWPSNRGGALLKSKLGEGTTVEIWLPAAPKPPASATLAATEAAAVSDQPLTILAVDDDYLVLTNMVAMLEDLGHKVFEANSGRQALGSCGHPSIDPVIPTAMPRITGLQLISEIKSEWPDLPIILATGYAELPPEGASLPRLAKPFMQHDLAAVVKSATASPGGKRS